MSVCACVCAMCLLLHTFVNGRHFLSTREHTEAFFRYIEVQIFLQAIMYFFAVYKNRIELQRDWHFLLVPIFSTATITARVNEMNFSLF